MILVPDSALSEFNACHVPAGTTVGGQFGAKGQCGDGSIEDEHPYVAQRMHEMIAMSKERGVELMMYFDYEGRPQNIANDAFLIEETARVTNPALKLRGRTPPDKEAFEQGLAENRKDVKALADQGILKGVESQVLTPITHAHLLEDSLHTHPMASAFSPADFQTFMEFGRVMRVIDSTGRWYELQKTQVEKTSYPTTDPTRRVDAFKFQKFPEWDTRNESDWKNEPLRALEVAREYWSQKYYDKYVTLDEAQLGLQQSMVAFWNEFGNKHRDAFTYRTGLLK